jgi:hypothetical protein
MKTMLSTVALLFASLSSAVAAGSAAHIDTSVTYNSGILVLAFAGFLALVVVMQTVPALISLYGMIKGAAESAKEKQAVVTSTSRN